MDGGYLDNEIDILEGKVVDKNCHTMKTDVQNILTRVVGVTPCSPGLQLQT